jgi:uncharacterized SAM-binding protein YcdF (DUF218 family)
MRIVRPRECGPGGRGVKRRFQGIVMPVADPARPQSSLAVVVLGCRPGTGAFTRRAKAARDVYFARDPRLIVACGGRAWDGKVEADELARLLREGDVPDGAIVRERCSFDTRDNARFAAGMLKRRGIEEVVVVTCTWHLPRAVQLFRAAGLRVEGHAVHPPNPTLLARTYWYARERFSTWKDLRKKVRPA